MPWTNLELWSMEFGVVTDLKRWANIESLSELWVERSQLIAEWIPDGAHVADIGCGRMALEGLLRGGSYYPIDVVARDSRTLVIDLNQERLPDSVLKKVDHVALLGVLEYLTTPRDLLRQLSSAGVTLICTYQLGDFSAHDVRAQNGWFTSFRAAEFPLVLHECGFEIVKSRLFDSQGLYLARPISPLSQPEPAVPKSTGRGTLVLSGFFGRGNAGDEALLQVQYEKFSPYFDIAIGVDEFGAYDGFWNWYPYDRCRIIHQSNTIFFSSDDVIGLHIGGGDLGFGFNGSQLLSALSAGKKVCVSGIEVSYEHRMIANLCPQLFRSMLDEFSLISSRSTGGHQFLQDWAPHLVRGADWALGLEADNSPDAEQGLTLIVLREFPLERVTPAYRHCVARLLKSLEDHGHKCALLPFCPEDERFLENLEATWGTPCERSWWNARRVKQLVKQAKFVISVGRLHPLIFSASVGTPCVFANFAADASHSYGKQMFKCRVLCEENKIPYFQTLSDLCDWTERGEPLPPRTSFSAEYRESFDSMVRGVVEAFSSQTAQEKTA